MAVSRNSLDALNVVVPAATVPDVLIAVDPPIVPDVIALPETLPAVLIVASLVSTIAAPAAISVLPTAPAAIEGLG